MKLIKRHSNGLIEVEMEDVLESLHDVGDYIEFEYKDYEIIEKKERRYILK